jgi:hypothetical protein
MELRFEWDRAKAAKNRLKHRVGFHEASTVFRDALGAIFDDREHSVNEPRELIIGQSIRERPLTVSFVEKPEACVRIISARAATKRETADFEKSRTG